METLLDALCKLNGQQGGTIHQFFPNRENFRDMENAFLHLRRCGITFNSKASMNKLAKQYHLSIKWE